MPTTTQFVVSGQSKPGVLAEVAAVLGAAGVNIKAFSAPEVTASGSFVGGGLHARRDTIVENIFNLPEIGRAHV